MNKPKDEPGLQTILSHCGRNLEASGGYVNDKQLSWVGETPAPNALFTELSVFDFSASTALLICAISAFVIALLIPLPTAAPTPE